MTYGPGDPRASLNSAPSSPADPAGDYAGAEYVKFYELPPVEESEHHRAWYARGQNFVLVYNEVNGHHEVERRAQEDEYVVLLPDAGLGATVTADGQTSTVEGHSLVVVPPGASTVALDGEGRAILLLTNDAEDLIAKAANAGSYATAHARVAPLGAWPTSPAGDSIRTYSLDVPREEGRFGRIFRCSTFMVNYLEANDGPRDASKLSPHVHEDFEQCSLAIDGEYIHHLRWPWGPDSSKWREDDHEFCASPSVAVIPPGSIHTSQAMAAGTNQLVDIFCPPRHDFSEKPGWVLNEHDYPSRPVVAATP